jgi:hypothetical protein
MTEFEEQLRTDLRELASTAPNLTQVGFRASAPAGVRPSRKGLFLPVLVGVASVAVIGAAIGAAQMLRADPSANVTSSTPPGSATTEDQHKPSKDAQQEVGKFLDQVRADYRSKVSLATDWDASTILIGVAPPVPAALERLDGTSVAGLRVDVFAAKVTTADYEAFIKAVGRANFSGKESVCDFSLPSDSASIQVNIAGLGDMTPTAVADLRAQLEALTDAAIDLTQAPEVSGVSACQR